MLDPKLSATPPKLSATPVDIPVEWAVFSHHVRYLQVDHTIDRYLRWSAGAWHERLRDGLKLGSLQAAVTVFTGHALAFHPTGYALVMESASRVLRVMPVDALRVT